MNEMANYRPIEAITEEIIFYKAQAGAAILEIGKRLNEAKAQLPHGEWLGWLQEKVDFSESTAQRFMRLAKEYENPSPVTDLGASKALVYWLCRLFSVMNFWRKMTPPACPNGSLKRP